MVEVNDGIPSLAGQRFHKRCFEEALGNALAALEVRGEAVINREASHG